MGSFIQGFVNLVNTGSIDSNRSRTSRESSKTDDDYPLGSDCRDSHGHDPEPEEDDYRNGDDDGLINQFN